MRSRIMVIGRDMAMRGRLARLVSQAGHRAEVAESFAHARRAGLDGVAVAIVDPDGLAADRPAVVQELRDAVSELLIVAKPGQQRLSPDAVDIADEVRLLARISEAVPSRTNSETGERVLEFAGYRLDLAAHSLTGPSAREVPLTPGEFSLLRALAERAGRALSRDQLLRFVAGREAEHYERGVDMQVMRLRRKIEPDPERPTLIVTVPGAGYKFAAPVREASSEDQAPRGASGGAAERSSLDTFAAKFAPPRLSIVVLPFANIGGGLEQEHFVDGVTESLTTDLSHIRGAIVIARNTAFTYKGKSLDAKTIGRELNVRYVLEGSVQRGGNRMRVNVQLIDAETGSHLWAERFDKPLADLFDTQDEIAARLANVVTAQVIAAEALRAKRTPNPDATDFSLQGWALWDKGITAENLTEARRLFKRALALNPADVRARVAIANVDIASALSFPLDDRVARLAAAETVLNETLRLDPENAVGHLCLGIVQIHTYRAAQGIRECERALELNRNLVNAHGHIGCGKIVLGRPEEAEAHILEALRLSPRDVHVYLWCMFAGIAKIYLNKEDEAVNWLRRSIEINRNFAFSYFILAVALARLGRLEEARSETRAGLSIDPSFTIARFRTGALTNDPSKIVGRDPVLIDGLRKAGVPEQ